MQHAGDYRFAAQLIDGEGSMVTTMGTRTTLAAGRGTMTVELDGRQLHDRGHAGPWTISEATSSDADLNLLDIAQFGPIGVTDPQAYEHDVLAISGMTEEALDPDGDGRIETLRLHADIQADIAGTYMLNGKLVSADGTDVGRTASSVYLGSGTTSVTLDFDGATIGATGKDGPFTLRDLTLYPASAPDTGLALVDSYHTQAYRSVQFPGGVSPDEPPVAAATVVAVDGFRVTFDASSSTDDHGIASLAWDFGDGSGGTGEQVSHVYGTPGTYAVTVVATDTSGQTSTAHVSVVVTGPVCDGRRATIVGDGRSSIRGTSGDDVIVGTAAAEQIDGGSGNDVICGGGGNDVLLGSNGSDKLFGGDGNDRLEGGDGDDVLDGGAGVDVILAANGNDTITGGAGNDTIDAGDGNDVVDAGDGDDVVTTANGNDTITGGAGNDSIVSGEGNDTVDAGDGDDRILAGGGQDTVHGGNGDDRLEGGEGNDQLWGDAGADVLIGNGGDDVLDGGPGPDVFDGGTGKNTVRDVA